MDTPMRENVTQREPGEVDLSGFRKCPVCNKLFFTSIDLHDHLQRHRESRFHGK